MKRIACLTTLCIVSLLSASARADCLSEAKDFALGLCGDLEKSGIKVSASGNLEGDAGLSAVIKRYIDVSGKGSVAGSVDKYEGLAREELGKDRFDTRGCRERLAVRAIEVQCKKVTYKTCPRPEFGIQSWGATDVREANSGWMGGGHSQSEWCGKLAAQTFAESGAGPERAWQVLNAGEDSRRTGLAHVEYNYKCKVQVEYHPNYNVRTDPLCGIASDN